MQADNNTRWLHFEIFNQEVVMKKMAVALASLMVVACTSTPKSDSSQTFQTNDKNTATAASSSAAATGMNLGQLTAEIQKLEKQSDYFDYNKFTVKPEFQTILQTEANFIKGHKQDIVTLEGNADERGSDKYNLDLGNKRAAAVEESLAKMGVPTTQIRIVSLGKEKPRLVCHQEKCWKENRRVDFIHQLN
jgi:peptidoglycan-associated lipoprotein